MGIMDREYWKEKYNKNSHYNPKEFRGRSKLVLVASSQQKWKKYFFIFLSLVMIASAFIVEKGYDLQDFSKSITQIKKTVILVFHNFPKAVHTLFQEDIVKSNVSGSKSENIKINSIEIENSRVTPTHVTVVQTNFTKKIEELKFNFTYIDYLENAKSYNVGLNYSTNLDKTAGVISIKPISCNLVYICKVGVTFSHWGATNSELGINSSYAAKPCEGKFVKGKNADDKVECVGNFGISIRKVIEVDLKKAINFSLKIKNGNALEANYINTSEKIETIGEFKMPSNFELHKSITTNIYFGEKISSCEKLKPLHVAMDLIINTNGNEIGSSGVDDLVSDEHPCRDYSKSKVIKDKIIMRIQS